MGDGEVSKEICPRCGDVGIEQRLALNALSRKDNKTYVCSSCGSDEAMINWRFGRDADVWPGYPGQMRMVQR